MHRSAVKSGLHDQRNRATTRRRDRNVEPEPFPDPDEELQTWLSENLFLTSLQELRSLDRKRFLMSFERQAR